MLTEDLKSGITVSVPYDKKDELIYHLIELGGYLVSPKQCDLMLRSSKSTSNLNAVLYSIGAVAHDIRKFIIYKSNAKLSDIHLPFGAIGIICENNTTRRMAMDLKQQQIQAIVQQVLAGMTQGAAATTTASTPAPSGSIPKTSRAAMLTALENYEIKEFPIPELGDDDILVKVEGCGVCGTDAHEFKRDPFGLIPVVLGHEGTGEIVKMGKNVKKDSAGKPLNIGDKVVTCMIFKDNPDITMFDLNKQNVGGADVYGLIPDDDTHLNGWFADYIVVRGGSTVFNVSDLDLDSRILIEPCAVLIHAVERAKTTGILRFNSRVAVQGCGPIGLICIAILRTMGIENIVAIDGEQKRLDFAKKFGATATVNFKEFKGQEALAEGVKSALGGYFADFAFQCTGSPIAHSNIYKFITNNFTRNR